MASGRKTFVKVFSLAPGERELTTVPNAILMTIIALFAVVIGVTPWVGGIAAAAPALPPRPSLPQDRPLRLGETFRSGDLGYTVHFVDGNRVSLTVHNPGPGTHEFSQSRIRVEAADALVYETDVFANLLTGSFTRDEIYDGQAVRLLMEFPANPVRILVSASDDQGGEYAVVKVRSV